MSSAAFETLFILLLIVANGVFSLSEIAIVSARKARLQRMAEAGDVRARVALELANEPGRFLSTVQIGITLVGILTGALSGATVAQSVAAALRDVPWLGAYSDAIGLGVVVLGITYLSLVIGELAPKQLALSGPERIATAVAIPMRRLSRLTAPIVSLLTASTALVLRLLGIRPSTEPPVTEDEVRVLIRLGTQAGVFETAEQSMIERVLRLGDRRVSSLMQPRTEIEWLDINDPPEVIRQQIRESRQPLFPVCEGRLDRVIGVAGTRELLDRVLEGEPLDPRAVAQPPLFVPETMRALQLLERFKQTGRHVALVIDEHGGTQGMVTPTDVLEAIVGDLPSPHEPFDPPAVRREDGSWLIDGLLPTDELKRLLEIRELPDEAENTYETVGGFIMALLGRVPATGDQVEWQDLRFEVVDMDERRVDKVLVTPLPTNAGPASGPG